MSPARPWPIRSGPRGGRPLLLRYGRHLLISPRDIARADRFFARHGDLAIFATRLLPVVRAVISLPAGVARMHVGTFVLCTFLGSLGWCFALASLGYTLGAHWMRIGAVLDPLTIVVIVALLILAAVFLSQYTRPVGVGDGEGADGGTMGGEGETGRPRRDRAPGT